MDNTKQKEELFKKIQLVINILTIVGVFAYILYLTASCPYITDDWHFKFVWRAFRPIGNDTRVANFGNIIESMKNYYNMSGGRVLCHFLAYIFVNINKNVFNVLNAVMFVLLGILIYRTATRRIAPPRVNLLLLLIYIAVILFTPLFGDVAIWLSGSVNYLWSTVLLLACFLLIDKCFDCLTLKKALLMSIPIAISAATNETTGGMLIVFMALTFIVKKKKFSPLYLIPLIAALPGMALVILAPGNSVRAQNVEHVELMSRSTLINAGTMYLKNTIILTPYAYMPIILSFFMKTADGVKNDGARGSKKVLSIVKNAFYAGAGCQYAVTGFVGTMALSATSYTRRPLILGFICIYTGAFASVLYIMDTIKNRDTRFKIKFAEIWYLLLTLSMPWQLEHLGIKKAFLFTALSAAAVYALEYFISKKIKPGKTFKFIEKIPMGLAASCAVAALWIIMLSHETVLYNNNVRNTENFFEQTKAVFLADGYEAYLEVKLEPYGEVSRLFSFEGRKSASGYTRQWYACYIAEECGDENLQVTRYFLS